MRILLCGYGRMGKMVERLALEAGDTVVERIDIDEAARWETLEKCADVVIDFSAPGALKPLAAYVQRTGTPLLSGTTAYGPEEFAVLDALGAHAPVLHSANYSVGVALLRRLLAVAAPALMPGFDAEITETHHNKKADAPSGTAKLLYEAIDPGHNYTPVYGREGLCGARNEKEIGIHALRGGSVAGTHTVSFFGPDEEISITHRAASRAIFAAGALRAAAILAKKAPGRYTLEEILFGEQ